MSGRGVKIRPAEDADLAAVSALLVETWHDTYDTLLGPARVVEITSAWHTVEALRKQRDLPATSFLVAEEGGAIVGHAVANGQDPPTLLLARLYVRPGSQRHGIGRRLLEAAAERHPDCKTMLLEVAAENAKAMAFYAREGFRPVGEKVVEGLDHLVMKKAIAPGL